MLKLIKDEGAKVVDMRSTRAPVTPIFIHGVSTRKAKAASTF